MTHFKTYLALTLVAVLSASPSFAQCWGGACQASIIYSVRRRSVRNVDASPVRVR